MVMPVARGFRQPLAAAYRTGMAGFVQDRVAAGDLRPGMLFRHCRVHQLDDARCFPIRCCPGWTPTRLGDQLNEPEDYAAARRRPPPGGGGGALRGPGFGGPPGSSTGAGGHVGGAATRAAQVTLAVMSWLL